MKGLQKASICSLNLYKKEHEILHALSQRNWKGLAEDQEKVEPAHFFNFTCYVQ